jgi:pimeloyl-ACP methyl ester carboxylesterase
MRQTTAPTPTHRAWWRRHPWATAALTATLLLLAYLVPSVLAVRSLTVAERKKLSGTPADRGLPYEDVAFTARADAVPLSGWWIDGSGGSRATVILIHGKDATRDAPDYNYLDLIAGIARGGYDVFTFDLRGHGESGHARFTLGHDEPDDVLGAIDYVTARGVPKRQIALVGFSTGAVSALDAAVTEPEIGAIVADGAWPSLRELLDQEIARQSPLPSFYNPGIYLAGRLLYGIDVDASRPIDDVAAIARANRPLLLIHSTEDEYTSVEQAHRLRDAAADDPNAEYWEIDDVEHVKGYLVDPDTYLARLLDFLGRSVGAVAD